MKRYVFLAAAVLIAAASCTKTYDASSIGESQIGFGTWSENLTRAEARVQGTNTFLAGDTFSVSGNKDMNSPSDPQTVFSKTVVTASGSGTLTWDYENHRFWDINYDKYTFYGVSPSAIGTDATTFDPATGEIETIAYTFSGANNDILVSNKTIVPKGSSPYFNNYGAVTMVFNHAAALVDVAVKKSPALADATVTVSAFALENINKTGALHVTAYDGSTNKPTITVANWTSSAPGTYLPAEGVTPIYGANGTSAIASDNAKTIATDPAFNAATPATPTDSTTLIKNLVVVPQTFDTGKDASTSQKITITYKVQVTGGDANEYTATLWLSDFDDVDDDAQDDTKVASWEPGKHYKFFITIDAHEIKFNAEINDWEALVNGYNYILN